YRQAVRTEIPVLGHEKEQAGRAAVGHWVLVAGGESVKGGPGIRRHRVTLVKPAADCQLPLMPDVVLRTASAADAESLSALDVAIWRASCGRILSPPALDGLACSPFHDPHYFSAIIDRIGTDEWLWVIEKGGTAVGYCHFGTCRDPASGHGGEIE